MRKRTLPPNAESTSPEDVQRMKAAKVEATPSRLSVAEQHRRAAEYAERNFGIIVNGNKKRAAETQQPEAPMRKTRQSIGANAPTMEEESVVSEARSVGRSTRRQTLSVLPGHQSDASVASETKRNNRRSVLAGRPALPEIQEFDEEEPVAKTRSRKSLSSVAPRTVEAPRMTHPESPQLEEVPAAPRINVNSPIKVKATTPMKTTPVVNSAITAAITPTNVITKIATPIKQPNVNTSSISSKTEESAASTSEEQGKSEPTSSECSLCDMDITNPENVKLILCLMLAGQTAATGFLVSLAVLGGTRELNTAVGVGFTGIAIALLRRLYTRLVRA